MNDLVLKNGEAVCDRMWKSIYILLAEDESIKIGVSQNVGKRIRTLQNTSGKKIIDYFFTQKCSNAYSIENTVLKHFAANRKCGEWISGNFDEVVSYAKKVFGEESKFEPSKEWDVEGAWSLFESMTSLPKTTDSKRDIWAMTVRDFTEKLKSLYVAFVDLCGEDDDVCTLPTKEKYEQMLSIIDYLDELLTFDEY